MVEARGRIRSEYHTTVTIKVNSQTVESAETKDISLNGVFIFTPTTFPLNTECDVILNFPGQMRHEPLHMKAIVARVTHEGMGLTFKEMDIETYQELKKIILYNNTDPDDFLDQCKKRPGFK